MFEKYFGNPTQNAAYFFSQPLKIVAVAIIILGFASMIAANPLSQKSHKYKDGLELYVKLGGFFAVLVGAVLAIV